jgi:hypothetical protein
MLRGPRGRELPETHRQILNHYFQKRRLPRRVLDGVCQELHIDKAQSDFSLLQAAVAHLMLGGTNRRLGRVRLRPDGTAPVTRRPRVRRVGARPAFLFSIEWPDSAIASGRTSYFATAAPGYERTAITASMPTPELFGYCDVALGHFPATDDVLQCVRPVVVQHWSALANREHERWQEFCEGGLVGERTATDWADEVW